MKQLNIFRTTHNKIIGTTAAVTVFFMAHPVYAQVSKLKRAKEVLETVKSDLSHIIPIAAAVILLFLAIGYAGRYIGKDTFVRWGAGVIIAGSATELVNFILKSNIS
ncbi:VirB2 family type IV secretion system major pilin TrwL [Bartonella rattaustraliani]|uniref:VirB2 family type IV secretion system major pilin TrwL n=1 Tax=Bartonella rattaustraliani TaxID=481139 RepID=UPI0002E7C088|nr:VirB2 family type IV secretion system major pilin TrwL [Bartonella rattaustraliani]